MKSVAVVVALVLVTAPRSLGATIYDNASTLSGAGLYGLVTHPGGGSGGADLSAVTGPDTTFGFSANSAGPFRLADDFTVPVGFQWTIDAFRVFTYSTGSVVPTVTAGTVQVWDGTPGGGGSSVIAGDTATNVLTANAFLAPAIYRASSRPRRSRTGSSSWRR